MKAPMGGPVSEHLEAEVRKQALGRRILVWLDGGGHYTGFVDRLRAARAAGEVPYEVYGLRGSYLALLLELEAVAVGAEPAPVVIHLPGHNEESVRATPLLELYLAGTRYRKALRTLVTETASGHVKPDDLAAFLGGSGARSGADRAAGNPRAGAGEAVGAGADPLDDDASGLSLEAADAWLAARLAGDAGGLADTLRTQGPAALVDDLLTNGATAQAVVASPANARAVLERFHVAIGVPASWCAAIGTPDAPNPRDLAVAATSWSLAVEYVHDLGRAPVSPHLAEATLLVRPLVKACGDLARHLRDRHRTHYLETADETEGLLDDEVRAARAADLGRIDTFRFEEAKILDAALRALEREDWGAAQKFATERAEGDSFWLREEPAREAAWQLVAHAAGLGVAIAAACEGIGPVADLEAALARYVERGAAVDRAHRHLEERSLKLFYPQLPQFETIRARLDGARAAWRRWADRWALDLHEVCRTHGWLPPAALQQRKLFDDVVRPLAHEGGPVAYFVVDALRFEMAGELFEALREPAATTIHLRARLAELPSVTEVGMNALAPVAATGRLRAALADGCLAGFTTGEIRVHDPESRKRAMQARVGGATCPWLSLDEVTSRDPTSLKRAVARAQLVVVHSREIDVAGESGAGPAVFQHVLQKLRVAWRLLREAGVRRFVITADHGFLLCDAGTVRRQAHGRKVDPKARYVLTRAAAERADEVSVALADLGYEGEATEGLRVVFPATTAAFDTGRALPGFVHGGPTFQERVIPVLTIEHRAPVGASTQRYRIGAEPREGVAGMHCLEVGVEAATASELAFGILSEVELAMRVVDPDDAGLLVELCQTRGGARLAAGALVAPVGGRFELFFRLTGDSDARARVELYHPSRVADVEAFVPAARFEVSPSRGGAPKAERPASEPIRAMSWLEALPPEGGVRALFRHLAEHGSVSEEEAAHMLGGPRELRRFASRFEAFAQHAPFAARIVVVGGVKRYEREGGGL